MAVRRFAIGSISFESSIFAGAEMPNARTGLALPREVKKTAQACFISDTHYI